MYCSSCGFYSENGLSTCRICQSQIVEGQQYADQKILLDITKVKTFCLSVWLKKKHAFHYYIYMPLFFAIVAGFRLVGRPLWIAHMLSGSPRYKLDKLKSIVQLKTSEYQKITTFLKEKGMKRILEFEDVNKTAGVLTQVWKHPKAGFYANIHINKSSGKIEFTDFTAVTRDKHISYVHNSLELPFNTSSGMSTHSFSFLSVPQLYLKFVDIVKKRKCGLRHVKLTEYFKMIYKIDKYVISSGLKQKFFRVASDKSTQPLVCYFHHSRHAIRQCDECKISVCEECIESIGKKNYCKTCFEKVGESSEPKVIPARFKSDSIAGLGLRLNAFLIDILIMLGSVFLLHIILNQIFGVSAFESVAFFFVQMLFLFMLFFNFIYLRYKNGSSPGERIWGVRYQATKADKTDLASVIVFFTLNFVATLTLIPLITYIISAFRKNKDTFFDKAAGIFPIVKNGRSKSILAWVTLLPVLLILIIPVKMEIQNTLTSQSHFIKQWEMQVSAESDDDFRNRMFSHQGNLYLYDNSSLMRIDPAGGDTLWEITNSEEIFPVLDKRDCSSSLILAKSNRQSGLTQLTIIEENTGEKISEITPELNSPILIVEGNSIVLYQQDRLYCYDRTGNLQFEKTMTNMIEDVKVNEGLLVSIYHDSCQQYYFLDSDSGQELWVDIFDDVDWTINLGAGYQGFCSKTGQNTLMYLPEKHIVNTWFEPTDRLKSTQSFVYQNNKSDSGYILTQQGRMSKETNQFLTGTDAAPQFDCASKDYLIDLDKSSSTDRLVFCDNHSGEPAAEIKVKDIEEVNIISESEEYLVLRLTSELTESLYPGAMNKVMVLAKHNFKPVYIKAPHFYSFENCSFFTDTHEVLFVGHNKAGLFELNVLETSGGSSESSLTELGGEYLKELKLVLGGLSRLWS